MKVKFFELKMSSRRILKIKRKFPDGRKYLRVEEDIRCGKLRKERNTYTTLEAMRNIKTFIDSLLSQADLY